MRTIVLSDAHAYPQMIRGALEHSRFRPGVDRLIYAGDVLDRGDDPEESLHFLQDAGAALAWVPSDLPPRRYAEITAERVTVIDRDCEPVMPRGGSHDLQSL